jgi:hypothetical protein
MARLVNVWEGKQHVHPSTQVINDNKEIINIIMNLKGLIINKGIFSKNIFRENDLMTAYKMAKTIMDRSVAFNLSHNGSINYIFEAVEKIQDPCLRYVSVLAIMIPTADELVDTLKSIKSQS